MSLTIQHQQDLENAIKAYDFSPSYYDFTQGKEISVKDAHELDACLTQLLRSPETEQVKNGIANVVFCFSSRNGRLKRAQGCFDKITPAHLDGFQRLVADGNTPTVGEINKHRIPYFSKLSFATKLIASLDPENYCIVDLRLGSLRSVPGNALYQLKLDGKSIPISDYNIEAYYKWCEECRGISNQYYDGRYRTVDIERGFSTLLQSSDLAYVQEIYGQVAMGEGKEKFDRLWSLLREAREADRWDDVGSMATEIIALNPKDPDAHIHRGVVHGRQGEYDLAIADFDQAIILNPKNTDAYLNRGVTYARQEDYGNAITDYERAIALDAKDVGAYLRRGAAYVRKGEYDPAIADFNQAIDLAPRNADAFLNRGALYCVRGEYQQMMADFDNAIKLRPKGIDGYLHRGVAYSKEGYHDKAITDFNRAIKLDSKSADAYLNRSVTYGRMGEYDRAIADCEKAIGINPHHAEALHNRAIALALVELDTLWREHQMEDFNYKRSYSLSLGRLLRFLLRSAPPSDTGRNRQIDTALVLQGIMRYHHNRTDALLGYRTR